MTKVINRLFIGLFSIVLFAGCVKEDNGDSNSETEELQTISCNGTINMEGLNTNGFKLEKYSEYAHPNKHAIILDFFAGSGTTGQAVLELNKSDGGKRQFILCTNNENQIAEEVTYPRIKTVITGIRPDGSKYSDGIPANVRYFKTDFVSKNKTNDKFIK